VTRSTVNLAPQIMRVPRSKSLHRRTLYGLYVRCGHNLFYSFSILSLTRLYLIYIFISVFINPQQ